MTHSAGGEPPLYEIKNSKIKEIRVCSVGENSLME